MTDNGERWEWGEYIAHYYLASCKVVGCSMSVDAVLASVAKLLAEHPTATAADGLTATEAFEALVRGGFELLPVQLRVLCVWAF